MPAQPLRTYPLDAARDVGDSTGAQLVPRPVAEDFSRTTLGAWSEAPEYGTTAATADAGGA